MKNRRRGHFEEDPHLERWLISYADYMTLMFALFVVLYAFALAKEENYRLLTNSLVDIFHLSEPAAEDGHGLGVLNAQDNIADIEQYSPGMLDTRGSSPVEGDNQIINLDTPMVGTPFSSMKEKLNTDLLELVNQGSVKIEEKDDWLLIELSSGLLFESGNATPRNSTRELLIQVTSTISQANNFIRVRGYTDDQPINNEVFKSNWQLSVARATAIVEQLQQQGIEPPRLAIEGYGQYQPKSANDTAAGRASNRRVVIALSRFGWKPPAVLTTEPAIASENQVPPTVADSEEMQVIELPGGGIRITTRKEKETL